MGSPVGTIFAHGTSPPWLPREVAEARVFAFWAQILFFLAAVGWFIVAIVGLTVFAVGNAGAGSLALGAFGLVAMLICFLAAVFMKRTVIDAIDQGRFHDAKNDAVIWIVFGLLGFVLPALLLILTYVKISDSLAAQQPPGYSPYAPGTVQVQQPAPYAPPPPAPVQPTQAPPPAQQPAQAYHAHQTPMIKCKNCSVQYPMFMHSCPNCGAPKE